MARIVIGSYFDTISPLHRADPRFKMLLALIYMVAIFVAPGFPGFAVMAVFTLVLIRLSHVPMRIVMRSISPLLFILVFTVLLNLFFITDGEVLWHYGIITITTEGVYRAIFYPLRMALLLLGMSLLTLTTTPIDITDATEQIMRPLGRLGFPAHELAMMLGIALRFLPVFMDEFVKIRRAQESRGADFGGGNLLARTKALLPIMVPLFVSAFRHAENLAQAMESRCYHGGEGRTRMNVLVAKRSDYGALAIFLLLLAVTIIMRILL